MVGVNKPIRKTGDSAQNAPKRRPRNTELNSSKKPLTGKICTAGRNPFVRKLNCSKLTGSTFDGKTYDEARKILMSDELGYEQLWDYFGEYMPKLGEEVGKQVDMQYGETADVFFNTMAECSTEEEFIRKVQEQLQEYPSLSVDSSCGDKTDVDSNLNCESGSATVSGTVTIYNDFADLDNDTAERLLRSRVEKAVPGAKVDFEKVNDTDVKVKIDCPDADAEKARLAVESSDVTKSVDWSADTAELDSANSCSASLDSAEDKTESEAESTTITTESGNEVSLSDIKIVQNPDTNELALFIKETEDDEIPEGFVVIADATQTALSSDSSCPKCGKEPCVCEDNELDSSKKKNRR